MIYLGKINLGLVSLLAIASLSSNPVPGWTQPSSLEIAELPPAPDTGTPSDGQKTPGGSRDPKEIGACKQTDKPLTALVPQKGNQGLTTAQNPVLWFYIPYNPKEVHSIEFSLHNRAETATVYRTSPQLTQTPGVIGIPVPANPEKSLKVNEPYHWYFQVNCDPQEKPENAVVLDGWVTRVEQSPKLRGVIWYDELTNRAKRYLSAPENPEVKKAWVEMLQAVGLAGVAQAPVVSP